MQLYCAMGTVHEGSLNIPAPPPLMSLMKSLCVCVLLWLFIFWLTLSLFSYSVSYSKYWMHIREVKLPNTLYNRTKSGTWWRVWAAVSGFPLQTLLILWINDRVRIFVLVFYEHVSTMVINRLFQSISGFIAFTIMFCTKLNTKSIISIKCRILQNYWH